MNLVENAHRASPPEAPIEILAAADRGDPALVGVEVLDRGAGLPAEPLRLGERRGSPLPSSAGDTPRRGLGLEIARSFAAALGGEVSLLPREGGGVRACVSLRAVAAAEGC